MFSFANEISFSIKKAKRKKAKESVFKVYRSRGLYKARGSTTAPKSPPSKIVVPKKRGTEFVSHCLPTAKKVRKAHLHNQKCYSTLPLRE